MNGLVGRMTECHCGALRLQSQLEFIRALINISKKLQPLDTKELRGRSRKVKCKDKCRQVNTIVNTRKIDSGASFLCFRH